MRDLMSFHHVWHSLRISKFCFYASLVWCKTTYVILFLFYHKYLNIITVPCIIVVSAESRKTLRPTLRCSKFRILRSRTAFSWLSAGTGHLPASRLTRLCGSSGFTSDATAREKDAAMSEALLSTYLPKCVSWKLDWILINSFQPMSLFYSLQWRADLSPDPRSL